MTESALLIDFYRGAVYPLGLEGESGSYYEHQNTKCVKPLVNLCAAYIVLDCTMTKIAAVTVPNELKIILMQEALLCSRDQAFGVLMYEWPISYLSLKSLVPGFCSTIRPLYDLNFLMTQVHKAMLWTTCLVNAFIKGMQKDKFSVLRYLDLSGYPTSEVIVSYLAVSCLMSYSDNATKQQVQPAITTATRSLNKDRGITDDTFVVKLDALLMSDQALQELAKAMVVISDCHCKLHLCINKLGVTCNGAKKTAVLLREIDHQELHGLCLKFNALTCVDLVGLAPSIKSLVNLTAIDLSCNNINFYLSDTTCDLISEVFKHLRQLSRLDLSNNRIKTKLRRLLAEIPQSLTYLRLAACGLTVTDITYLARSHHCEHLTELDLSENGLGRACTYVVQLLYALSKNLRVLEIEDSFLKDEHILAIEPAVRSMESLLYINVAENVFSRNMQKLLTKAISGIQSMQVFRLSYASDCYLFESNEEESNAQSQNLKELEELAVRHTEKSSQLKIEIIELCRGH